MLTVAAAVEESVTIFHNIHDEYVQAKIVPMSSQHIQDIELLWLPQLKNHNCWDRDLNIHQYLNHPEIYQVYVLEYDAIAQGIIILQTNKYHSRLDVDKNLIYVHLLTVAPWNRAAILGRRNYKGVGTVLLAFAMLHSFNLGFQGRIALNTVKEAEDFYQKLPFFDGGYDLFPAGNDGRYVSLKYLEMPEEEAELVMLNLYLTGCLN